MCRSFLLETQKQAGHVLNFERENTQNSSPKITGSCCIIITVLKRLCISNFAIIENVDVTFSDGFSVLTGETGAGKSLVIDSLSLLLGARASNELIRQGEDKATVIGYFEVSSPQIEALLSSLGVESSGGEIIIERVISKTKNAIRINNVGATLADLNRIAPLLADIHNQFDTQKLFNPENYIRIIDGYRHETSLKYLSSYCERLEEYKAKRKELEEAKKRKSEFERDRDFYIYQLNELKAFGLRLEEEQEIAAEIELLKNYDKVYSLSQQADSIIREDFLDRLYELNKTLEKLSQYREDCQQAYAKLDESYYEIEEIFSTLKKSFSSFDYDPSKLDELMSRQSDLEGLKRKYRRSIQDLIAYRDELETMVGEDGSFDARIKTLEGELSLIRTKVLEEGRNLSLLRRQSAKGIEKEISGHLSDLGLHASFAISFQDADLSSDDCFGENGLDVCAFLIETNVGEGMKNLDKVVSGGEASRIMLAFKAIMVKANKIPTVIFDEIDTGLSGEISYKVAKKIHELSLSHQVFAITHMPQVASLADHAIKISKTVKNGRTYTNIQELTLEENIREIAFLISDGHPTDKQMEYAREMVLLNR